ncbi:MAG TPA: helix-turn-helix domain-containing protein [Pyrinomonadaceae bacterium]|jgi:excisionase family DNA binding protein|nr:helix-turn-helix domain-containing protein [Pyrinomonadaceae bacterium]
MSESKEWITQTEAAKLRGVSLPSITELVNRGRLRSKEVYGKRLVNRSDVVNFERAKPSKVSKSKAKK